MNRVNVTGERSKFWYKMPDESTRIDIKTADDYKDKAKKDNLIKLAGRRFLIAKLVTTFDTPNEELNPGDYSFYFDEALQEERILAKTSLDKWYNLSKNDIEAIHALSPDTEYPTWKGLISTQEVAELKTIPVTWQ